MEIRNLQVVHFPSPRLPEGILADVELEGEIILAVYRPWDQPQWYLEQVILGLPGESIGNIDDRDRKHPIPLSSDLSRALDKAIESIRQEYSPA